MPNLSTLTNDELRNFLLNAVRNLETRPEEAQALLPDIVAHIAARRALGNPSEHLLTSLGYNVRWRDWRARERRALILWLMDAQLPEQIEREIGQPRSDQRTNFFISTISRWIRMYGNRPNMESAVTRWTRDLQVVENFARARD